MKKGERVKLFNKKGVIAPAVLIILVIITTALVLTNNPLVMFTGGVDPECADGIDNDFDGEIDYDGLPPFPPDAVCEDQAEDYDHECVPARTLFRITAPENSHATRFELGPSYSPFYPDYIRSICWQSEIGDLSRTCSPNAAPDNLIVRLSDPDTNAHVESASRPNYPGPQYPDNDAHNICFGSLRCQFEMFNCDPNSDRVAIASVESVDPVTYEETNMHVGGPDNYDFKLCCTATSGNNAQAPPDGSGFDDPVISPFGYNLGEIIPDADTSAYGWQIFIGTSIVPFNDNRYFDDSVEFWEVGYEHSPPTILDSGTTSLIPSAIFTFDEYGTYVFQTFVHYPDKIIPHRIGPIEVIDRPICGDGLQKNLGEACDGSDLDGETCTSLGAGTGTLACGNDCSAFDLSGCSGCGNGEINSGENCDDGQLPRDNDGCSSTCSIEPGWDCSGTPSFCSASQCGDGIKAGEEECDDGNVVGEDGCSSTCTVVPGWDCVGEIGEQSVCNGYCGDRLIKGTESQTGRCDDGDVFEGDGCGTFCEVEHGWYCDNAPSTSLTESNSFSITGNAAKGGSVNPNRPGTLDQGCTSLHTICGDGIPAGIEGCFDGGPCSPEECDDGPDGSFGTEDGCNGCLIDEGWECWGEPSECAPICGDSLIRGREVCDNGGVCASNNSLPCTTLDNSNCPTEPCIPVGNDGCSENCDFIETGWQCEGEPSVCDGICGDGLVVGSEECEDENDNNYDYCTNNCRDVTCGDNICSWDAGDIELCGCVGPFPGGAWQCNCPTDCEPPGGPLDCNSFLPGTKVTMADGSLKNIEDIKLGDMVLGYDEKSGKVVPSKVSNLISHPKGEYYIINERLRVTAQNPLYVNGQWIVPPEMKLSDEIMNTDKNLETVSSIEHVVKDVFVYTLTVEDTHNFFVDNILAHNKRPPRCEGVIPATCQDQDNEQDCERKTCCEWTFQPSGQLLCDIIDL